MFRFFKKDKGYSLPETYSSFINKEEYNYIISLCKDYFAEAGTKIIDIKEGEIIIESGEEEKHCYLDNLVRKVYQQEKDIWKDVIYEHFDFLKEQPGAFNFFFKDFEYASPLLRAFIKPEDFFPDKTVEYVHRIDFPETQTVLALEHDNKFRFCLREDIKEWGVPDEELFSIAITNNPNDEVEAKEYLILDKFTAYMFFSGDYAAGMLLDMENNFEYAIGTYGSLVAIPAKGFAFAAPIESADIMKLLETVLPTIESSFNEDQGNITQNFYWYYDKKFVKFPVLEDGEKAFIRLPEELKRLLEKIAD